MDALYARRHPRPRPHRDSSVEGRPAARRASHASRSTPRARVASRFGRCFRMRSRSPSLPIVLLYALIPQDALGGHAHRQSRRATRSATTSPASPRTSSDEQSCRACATCAGSCLAAAASVAAWGLIDAYAIDLDWWRHNGTRRLLPQPAPLRLRPRALPSAGELRLQQRERAGADAATHLDLPVAARHRVPLRRRAPPRAAHPRRVTARRARSGGPALDAHARGAARARRRPRRPRARSVAVPGRSSPRSPRSPSASPSSPSSRHRPARALHAARARVSARAGAEERADEARAVRRVAPQRALGRDHSTVADHPQGYGLGNAGEVAHSARTSRSRPESRTTPSSASRPACFGALSVHRVEPRAARRARPRAPRRARRDARRRAGHRDPDRRVRHSLDCILRLVARRLRTRE